VKLDEFYELMLDNIPYGIYILDAAGNYLFVNSTYLQTMNMSKKDLLAFNVHDFLSTNQITFCISDIVHQKKRRVVMFQDVQRVGSKGNTSFRQLVISNPVFGPDGEVQNVIAVCKSLDTLNEFYNEASMSDQVSSFAQPMHAIPSGESVIAESQAMRGILSMAKEVADVDTSLLITGESGTGKEVVAQYVHQSSKRAGKKLVIINCASLPENLLEAELFGYEKGAFTGASPNGKAGLFELADGGTLFLDEVNSLPYALQGKLLRAIETKSIQRIGSTHSKEVDFRLISATNEDLWRAVTEKRFRADLFYRLNVIPLNLVPLRERREDIIPLALHFLKNYNSKYNKNKLFTETTMSNIQRYPWYGNVRELKNFVERSVVMTASDYIEISDIGTVAAGLDASSGPHRPQSPLQNTLPRFETMMQQGVSLEQYVSQCECEYLEYAMTHFQSSYAVAEALGTSQSAIMRKKKKYQLH